MITYLWATGLAFTIFVFAGKAGLVAGSVNLKTSRVAGLVLLYGLLTFLMGVVLKIYNPLDYIEFFQKFMSYGVILHFFFSLGLAAWGLFIIRSAFHKRPDRSPNAGYILMLPCPVCLSAVFLSCSILVAMTGIDPLKAASLLSIFFMMVIAGVAFLAKHLMRSGKEATKGAQILGFVMMMAGLYFAISIIVVPVYSKAKALLSMMQGAAAPNLSARQVLILLAVASLICGLGFFKNRKELLSDKKICKKEIFE